MKYPFILRQRHHMEPHTQCKRSYVAVLLLKRSTLPAKKNIVLFTSITKYVIFTTIARTVFCFDLTYHNLLHIRCCLSVIMFDLCSPYSSFQIVACHEVCTDNKQIANNVQPVIKEKLRNQLFLNKATICANFWKVFFADIQRKYLYQQSNSKHT